MNTKKNTNHQSKIADIHGDLQNFNETKTSIKALMELKKNKKAAGDMNHDEMVDFKTKAFNALDSLFDDK